MNLFIATHFGDAHAIAVELALKQMGHNVFRWVSESGTSEQFHSISYQSKLYSYNISGPDGKFNLADFDVVWWRRQNDISIPEIINNGDREFALKEWRSVYSAMPLLFRSDARWINSWRGRAMADMKLLQLREALKIGFSIPETLVSNDAEAIREFVARRPAGVVHKMFEPAFWRDDDGAVRARTARVHPEHLTDSFVLSLCPGMFQERLTKSRELRVTFMGDDYVCVAIDPRDDPNGICDWRSIPRAERRVQAATLPEEVAEKCRLLMRRLNIVFGCFDIIETAEKDYIFLEVNENGQFLWIEKDIPETKMLGKFCSFLLDQELPDSPTMSDIFKSDEFSKAFEMERSGQQNRFERMAQTP